MAVVAQILLNRLSTFHNPKNDDISNKKLDLTSNRLELFRAAADKEDKAVEMGLFGTINNGLSLLFRGCESQKKRALREIYKQINSFTAQKTPEKALEKLQEISSFATQPNVFIKAVSFTKNQLIPNSDKTGYKLNIAGVSFDGNFLEADELEESVLFQQYNGSYKLKINTAEQYLAEKTLAEKTLAENKFSAMQLYFPELLRVNDSLPKKQKMTLSDICVLHDIVNQIKDKKQKMTLSDIFVLHDIVNQIKDQSIDISVPKLFKKREYNCDHSFLLYRNENGNICIIVKPNIKNDESKLRGSYKVIKQSGIELELTQNLQNYSVKKIVTCSKSVYRNKNRLLQHELGQDLIAEGFKEIFFEDRVIYVKKDLGTNLNDLISSDLIPADKIKIAKQLITKIQKGKTGDIKLDNTTYDGQEAHFIDDVNLIFTYTTKNQTRGGCYNEVILTQKTIDAIEKQQVLGLAYILFQLFNNLNKDQAYPLVRQLCWNAEREDLRPKSQLAIPQDYEPFSRQLLLKAYNESLTLEQLKEAIDSLR